ncbi:MAG: hypothetical protein KDH96_09300 [Candidatus Riesia sp.]|nr:hypothetical protein [Candidatus Riesia sp.]
MGSYFSYFSTPTPPEKVNEIARRYIDPYGIFSEKGVKELERLFAYIRSIESLDDDFIGVFPINKYFFTKIFQMCIDNLKFFNYNHYDNIEQRLNACILFIRTVVIHSNVMDFKIEMSINNKSFIMRLFCCEHETNLFMEVGFKEGKFILTTICGYFDHLCHAIDANVYDYEYAELIHKPVILAMKSMFEQFLRSAPYEYPDLSWIKDVCDKPCKDHFEANKKKFEQLMC